MLWLWLWLWHRKIVEPYLTVSNHTSAVFRESPKPEATIAETVAEKIFHEALKSCKALKSCIVSTGCSSVAGVENILTNCFSIRVWPLRHSSAPDSLFRWTPKWTTVKGWTGGWTLTTSKVDTDHYQGGHWQLARWTLTTRRWTLTTRRWTPSISRWTLSTSRWTGTGSIWVLE